MTPRIWRQDSKQSLRAVAAQLGVASAMTVLRYESGAREAPNRVALAYERVTGRQVTAEDLEAVRSAYLASHAASTQQVGE